jgi:SWIM zinc finger
MLGNWNFADVEANSTTHQVNRQKSAHELTILELDQASPRATFFDPGRGETHTATLKTCDCRDFSFIGGNPRANFKPCMHIYRLAIALGLMEAKYLGRVAQTYGHAAATSASDTSSREETERLKQLPKDASQWGSWPLAIHNAQSQRMRQFRAYEIMKGGGESVELAQQTWRVHGYRLTLGACECMDFNDRRLPCKHIYAAALASGLALCLTPADYENQLKTGIGI